MRIRTFGFVSSRATPLKASTIEDQTVPSIPASGCSDFTTDQMARQMFFFIKECSVIQLIRVHPRFVIELYDEASFCRRRSSELRIPGRPTALGADQERAATSRTYDAMLFWGKAVPSTHR
mgnify:CR=1 FL=1